jgi:acetolactate synthase-1/3 small subunit
MQSLETENQPGTGSRIVLELTVRNHPGVMAHVCGLFSRRAYNLEGIACLPMAETGGAKSRIWLLIEQDSRLEQIVKQVEKLEDVEQALGPFTDLSVFNQLSGCLAYERGGW